MRREFDEIEELRLQLQTRLDSMKTQEERNKLGQFATPPSLATQILECARSLMPPTMPVRFLDPAIGTGSFYSALLRAFPSSRIEAAVGYEIDPHYGDEAGRLWKESPLELHLGDFTQVTAPSENDRATLLISNPPYVRHHHLPAEEKIRLQRLCARITNLRLSGLAGLYCYFMLIAHEWMAEDGIACWLIPSEFMDVNYGEQVKRYLLERVTLLRIHRFDPAETQFDDALVSSAVIWFRKSTPPVDHAVSFSYGGTLLQPKVCKEIPITTLRTARKWTGFPLSINHHSKQRERTTLSDLFKIQRGIATGANEFFLLTPQQAEEHQIPAEFLKPILPSPRYLSCNEIMADEQGNPLLERRLFLLSCNLSESQVQAEYPTLWKYLQHGIEQGIHQRYLCTHRSPWYAQETRLPSPFLCTYMGRSNNGIDNPFRFILNHSRAIAANVYLMLYPRPALQESLSDESLLRAVWEALNRIKPEMLVGEGRVYGGGLHKMEPKELGNASAEEILALLSQTLIEIDTQLSLFNV